MDRRIKSVRAILAAAVASAMMLAGPAAASDAMEPLMQMLGEHPGQDMSSKDDAYILGRCSALFATMAVRLRQSGRAGAEVSAANADAAGEHAIGMALTFDPTLTPQVVSLFSVTYDADMTSNMAHFGDAFVGYIADDLSLCASLIKK